MTTLKNIKLSGITNITDTLNVSGKINLGGDNNLSGKILLSGDSTFSGSVDMLGDINIYNSSEFSIDTQLDMNNNKIINIKNPTDHYDAVNKTYVDNLFAGISPDEGDLTVDTLKFKTNISDICGNINIDSSGNITTNGSLNVQGTCNMENIHTGNIDLRGNRILNIITPSIDSDVTTKLYVDKQIIDLSTNKGDFGNVRIKSVDASNGEITAPHGNLIIYSNTGVIDLSNSRIINSSQHIDDDSALTTKLYVDTSIENLDLSDSDVVAKTIVFTEKLQLSTDAMTSKFNVDQNGNMNVAGFLNCGLTFKNQGSNNLIVDTNSIGIDYNEYITKVLPDPDNDGFMDYGFHINTNDSDGTGLHMGHFYKSGDRSVSYIQSLDNSETGDDKFRTLDINHNGGSVLINNNLELSVNSGVSTIENSSGNIKISPKTNIIDINNSRIENLAEPTNNSDAATKNFVLTHVNSTVGSDPSFNSIQIHNSKITSSPSTSNLEIYSSNVNLGTSFQNFLNSKTFLHNGISTKINSFSGLYSGYYYKSGSGSQSYIQSYDTSEGGGSGTSLYLNPVGGEIIVWNGLKVQNPGEFISSGTYPIITVENHTSSGLYGYKGTIEKTSTEQTNDNQGLLFNVQDNNVAKTAITILSNGNVGIGIEDPSKNLHVNGETILSGKVAIGSGFTSTPNIFDSSISGNIQLGSWIIDGGTGSSSTSGLYIKDNNNTNQMFFNSSGVNINNELTVGGTGIINSTTLNASGNINGYDIGPSNNVVLNKNKSVILGEWYVYGDGTNLYFNFNNSANSDAFIKDLPSNDPAKLLNFTGQHRTLFSEEHRITVQKMDPSFNTDYSDNVLEGFIVSSTGKYINNNTIEINEAIPYIELANKIKDKRVYGVLSEVEDISENSIREFSHGAFTSTFDRESEIDHRVHVNSVGEGGIWICNMKYDGSDGEIIENGDYITTSPIPGIGMLQTEEYLAKYTVAKSTTDCSFNGETFIIEDFSKNPVLDSLGVHLTYDSGRLQYEPVLDGSGNYIIEPVLDSFGVPISQAKFDEKVVEILGDRYKIYNDAGKADLYYEHKFDFTNGTTIQQSIIGNTYKMAFIGCTYHCG
jgi:hypothetical protein